MLFPLMNAAADSFEAQAADVVPVEPDEERPASDMIIRHKTPVSAVVAIVAIVAYHEIVARRYLACEAALIVDAVFVPWERTHVLRIDGLCGRIFGNRVLVLAGTLEQALGGNVHQSLQIAVGAIGPLRQGMPVDDELLVLIGHFVARQTDD